MTEAQLQCVARAAGQQPQLQRLSLEACTLQSGVPLATLLKACAPLQHFSVWDTEVDCSIATGSKRAGCTLRGCRCGKRSLAHLLSALQAHTQLRTLDLQMVQPDRYPSRGPHALAPEDTTVLVVYDMLRALSALQRAALPFVISLTDDAVPRMQHLTYLKVHGYGMPV